MKHLNTIIIFCFMLLCVGASHSQSNNAKPLRVEIELESNDDDLIRAIPVGKNGVVILQQSESDQKGKDKYTFSIYNTSFVKSNVKSIYLDRGLKLKQYIYDEELQKIYAYFYKKRQDSRYEIVSFSVTDSEVKSLSGVNLIKGDFLKMVAKNNVVYWSGYNLPYTKPGIQILSYFLFPLGIPYLAIFETNKVPTGFIVCNDFNTMKTNVKILNNQGATKVIDINTDQSGNIETSIESIIKGGKTPNYYTLYKKLDANLNDVGYVEIPTKEGKRLLSSSVTKTGESERILVGSYSTGKVSKKQNVSYAYNRDYSEGLYFSIINENETKFIKYYPYSKFKNYFEFYNQRFAQKMTRREQSRVSQGKKTQIRNMQLVHDVITLKNGEYVVVSEIYYPEYETQCHTTYSANGGYSTTCYEVFVGYRYTRALIAGFSKDGDLLWDQNFPIGDILTFNLTQRVKVMIAEDETLVFLYNNNGAINSISIKDGEKLDKENVVTELETNNSDDKVKENWSSNADFWYDKYFLTYGIQRIKNKDRQAGKKSRTVFYFSKIKYE